MILYFARHVDFLIILEKFFSFFKIFNLNIINKNIKSQNDAKIIIKEISPEFKLNETELYENYICNLNIFINYRDEFLKIFKKNKNISKLFFDGWYSPDYMGVISAANLLSIDTIDIQHGKQGKYQGMYSWWTKIPNNQYELMPKFFWMWGKESIKNMNESNKYMNENSLINFGYPWINFFKTKFKPIRKSDSENIILFSLQPPVGMHYEPIPNFILDYLKYNSKKIIKINFRIHPNWHNWKEYCHNRLLEIDSNKYFFTDNQTDLYTSLIAASHHITAFSSVCYEARLFKKPTLLFGEESKIIYKEKIKKGIFDWVDSNANIEEFMKWLNKNKYNSINIKDDYIDTSDKISDFIVNKYLN